MFYIYEKDTSEYVLSMHITGVFSMFFFVFFGSVSLANSEVHRLIVLIPMTFIVYFRTLLMVIEFPTTVMQVNKVPRSKSERNS